MIIIAKEMSLGAEQVVHCTSVENREWNCWFWLLVKQSWLFYLHRELDGKVQFDEVQQEEEMEDGKRAITYQVSNDCFYQSLLVDIYTTSVFMVMVWPSG